MNRCSWVNMNNELYIKYHDEEWGRKSFNDNHLFEMQIERNFYFFKQFTNIFLIFH